MVGDVSGPDQTEQARVRLVTIPRDRHSVRIDGKRVIEQPSDRNPEIIGTPREDRPQIFIDDEVYRQATSHLAADLNYERGGALIGDRNQTPQGQSYAEVTGFSPATHGSVTPIAFQFTPDDWADFTRDIDRRGKGE